MTFIQIDKSTHINAEIIALIEWAGVVMFITTKNGKTYSIGTPDLVSLASQKLGL
jgi:hypothetical protein